MRKILLLLCIPFIGLASSNRKLISIFDVLGRESKGTRNEPLFYIYDDGTVEKKIIIE